jgi:hypothetical protein
MTKVTVMWGHTKALHCIHHGYVPLQMLSESLPHWTIPQRKTLLTITRCQTFPALNTTVYSRLHDELISTVPLPGNRTTTLRDIILPISEFLDSPILSGYISMLVRSAPHEDLNGVEREFEEGIRKELSAAVEVYRPPSLHWDSVLSPRIQDRRLPLHEWYPVDVDLHTEIYMRLRSACQSMRGRIFFPDTSNKTMGMEACQEFSRCFPFVERPEDKPRYSLWDFERAYSQTGIQVRGRAELRMAFKYNDLKPRLYYARGSDQHPSSRYIQEIANILIDSLPCTHRFSRFFLSSIQGESGETAFIYDYASFTSGMEELKSALESLSKLCDGIEIITVDTYRGLVSQDLGKLLREYNSQCNDFVPFDIRRVSGLSSEETEPYPRHTCGMLGIPGNISFCTLFHGIHLSVILGSLSKGKAVGDDAGGWNLIKKKENLIEMLSNLGSISAPKMNFWKPGGDPDKEDETWHYVKRPIDRYETRLVQGVQASWPAVPELLHLADGIHTTSSQRLTEHEKMKKTASMLLSFVLQLQSFEPREFEIVFLDRFIRTMVDASGLREYESRSNKRFVYPSSFTRRKPIDELKDQYWHQLVWIPEDVSHVVLERPEKGIGFVGRSNKAIELASGLGFAVIEPKMKGILPSLSEEDFDRWLSKKISPAYDIFIYERCPSWLFDVIQLQYDFIHVDPAGMS